MRKRSKKDCAAEIKDPRVEFARLAAARREAPPTDSLRQPALPPLGVDGDFCFSEDRNQ